MNHPLISVIIPVYNVQAYLQRCLQSIITQTIKDFEVIIINDGSTDDSLSICEVFAKNDKRIRIINQSNSGVSFSRNVGLNNACGDYIGFVDSDDWLEPTAFETCIKILENNPNSIVKFGYYREMPDGNTEKYDIPQLKSIKENWEKIYYADKIEYHGFVWNMILSRKLISSLRFHEDINWLEDQLFGYECLSRASKVIFIPDKLYHYIYRPQGSLSSVKASKTIALASIREKNLKLKLSHNAPLFIKEEIIDDYIWRLEFLILSIYNNPSKISYKERKGYTKLKPGNRKMFLKEGRLFYYSSIPFFFRDFIIRILFYLKRIVRNTSLPRS